ncbi:MAG: tetratricopeptide repeat protein [Desulfobulbus sp.]|nr:tetratricopeptide repeat protein [Desulfobulbus sp.]
MLAAPPRAEAPPVASLIRVARTPPRLDPDLVYAHARLQAGDLAGASQAFALVLQRDPNQTDALLALAAIAQHQGRPDEAESWRQRALVADPSDPAVQAAALSGLAAGGEAQAAESRLKTLLAAQPQSAELNFALGNLYARQQRWAEAQQHFFNAVAADNDNPDYLFNLAVSLDQLRQPRPAAQHYRLALEAAARRPAAFDAEQVRRRLAALLPDSPP